MKFYKTVVILILVHMPLMTKAEEPQIAIVIAKYSIKDKKLIKLKTVMAYEGEVVATKESPWSCKGKMRTKKNVISKKDFLILSMDCEKKNSESIQFNVMCTHDTYLSLVPISFTKGLSEQMDLSFICYDRDDDLYKMTKYKTHEKFLESLAIDE